MMFETAVNENLARIAWLDLPVVGVHSKKSEYHLKRNTVQTVSHANSSL